MAPGDGGTVGCFPVFRPFTDPLDSHSCVGFPLLRRQISVGILGGTVAGDLVSLERVEPNRVTHGADVDGGNSPILRLSALDLHHGAVAVGAERTRPLLRILRTPPERDEGMDATLGPVGGQEDRPTAPSTQGRRVRAPTASARG